MTLPAKSLLRIAAVILLTSLVSNRTFAKPPAWNTLSSDRFKNIDEVDFVRDSSGTLHIAWPFNDTVTQGVRYAALSPDAATLSTPVTTFSGSTGLSNPGIKLDSGRIRIFFGSTGSVVPGTQGALYSVQSNDNGASWDFFPGQLSFSANVSPSDNVSVAKKLSELITTWTISAGVFYHRGEDALQIHEFEADQSGCCGYQSNLASDSVTGDTYVGWYSNATGQYGQYVQRIEPLEAMSHYVPGSAREDGLAALSVDQRMPISGRIGADGVFVAFCSGYPVCEDVRLWRVGETSAQLVHKQKLDLPNLAPAPDGKFWIMWADDHFAYVTRSNSDLTKFGAIQKIKFPGDQTAFNLSGEGSTGPLDLFALVGLSSPTYYYLRALPGLSVKGPSKSTKGSVAKFTVTDAGDPVQGAKVKAFGKSATTNAKGKAKIVVPFSAKIGNAKAKASKAGYANGSTKVKVVS